MPSHLKNNFTKQVLGFFQTRNINLEKKEKKGFVNYLYKQFDRQNGFKNNKETTDLSPTFMLAGLRSYFKINSAQPEETVRVRRPKRSGVTYVQLAPIKKFRAFSKSLIHLLGRSHKPTFKITNSDGSSLSPESTSVIKEIFSLHTNVNFSPLVKNNSAESARVVKLNSSNDIYEEVISGDGLTLSMMRSPGQSRVDIAPTSIKKDFEKIPFDLNKDIKGKREEKYFRFFVSKQDIINRLNVKRTVTQKTVMGVSALDYIKSLSDLISDKLDGRSYHWAHRQGWSLNGSQVKDNLDPMTAGSNYDTLFKIEAPLKKLLLEDLVEKISVQGKVTFQENGLLFKVEYNLTWGTANSLNVVIDPMNHRVPTVNENEVTEQFFRMFLKIEEQKDINVKVGKQEDMSMVVEEPNRCGIFQS